LFLKKKLKKEEKKEEGEEINSIKRKVNAIIGKTCSILAILGLSAQTAYRFAMFFPIGGRPHTAYSFLVDKYVTV
jgi:hypothetical protein